MEHSVVRTSRQKIFILIAAFSLVRLLVAPHFGLGVDEAHYVLYARYLDLSYFDHPPLVGWIHAIVYYTLGTDEFLARLPAIAISALTSYMVWRWLLACGFKEQESLWGVAALNGSFVFGALGLMLLPDCLLIVSMFAVLFATLRLQDSPTTANYAWLGLFLGFAGLSKYTAFLLIAALVLYAVWIRAASLIFTPKLAITVLTAAIVISPVIFWNISHDWASFSYQSDHIAGKSAWSVIVFARSLAAQFGAYSPPLFALAFWGFYTAFKNRSPHFRLSVSVGGVLLAFFFVTQGVKVALPHWISPFFALFIPMGAAQLASIESKIARRTLIASVVFSIAVTAAIYVELVLKLGRFKDFGSPFRDIAGWDTAMKNAADRLNADASRKKALAVTNWTTASRARYYTPDGTKLFLTDTRIDQFDIWENEKPFGYDLLFVNSHFFGEDIAAKFACESIQKAGFYEERINDGVTDRFEFVWCRNYQGFKH